ncbi:MAG: hypothetical protein KDC85_03115 [Saprospiraceae bacterium]|nr:hypothetical protein [Saprospiraceae bacterium]MCB9324704.1 hypothetical protein [Lewinellaceae bacterium]
MKLKNTAQKQTLVFITGMFLSTIALEFLTTDYSVKRIIIYSAALSLLTGGIWYFIIAPIGKRKEK